MSTKLDDAEAAERAADEAEAELRQLGEQLARKEREAGRLRLRASELRAEADRT